MDTHSSSSAKNSPLIRRLAYPAGAIGFALVLMTAFSAPVFSAPLDRVSLNGYLSVEYEKNIGGDDEGDANGSFDLDLVDLVFNIQATDKLRIATDFTWEHGAASEDGRGNVAIEYGFAEYHLSNTMKVRAGKMFTNFGIYNEIHTAKPATLTVKEPLATNKNNKLGSEIRFYPRWLVGLALAGNSEYGSKYKWDYILQLSNGETEDEDINPFEEDDNNHKAINGRFRYTPFDALQIGFSFYADTMEDPVNGGKIDLNSYGAQLEWESQSGIGIELEYTMGEENFTRGGIETDRRAYTLMIYQQLYERYTPYLRYESLDPNTDISNDEGSILILGINLLIDDNMYIKLEADRVSTDDNNAKFNGADFTEFKASLSIGF